MTYVALAVSGLALGFTIASFWWLHARTGSLEAAAPRSYAFADKVRVRLPFAFFNTGAKALIVTDLRLVIDNDPDTEPLGWITSRTKLRPGRGRDAAVSAGAESTHTRRRDASGLPPRAATEPARTPTTGPLVGRFASLPYEHRAVYPSPSGPCRPGTPRRRPGRRRPASVPTIWGLVPSLLGRHGRPPIGSVRPTGSLHHGAATRRQPWLRSSRRRCPPRTPCRCRSRRPSG